MGVGTNILIFMVILNIVFYIVGVDTGLTLIFRFLSADKNLNQVQVSGSLVAAILAVTATASIIATAFGLFPNISLAVLMTFLLSFATFPISVFNSMSIPFEFKLLFGGVITVLYLLALISFARGGEL
jgi:hypothetical protein